LERIHVAHIIVPKLTFTTDFPWILVVWIQPSKHWMPLMSDEAKNDFTARADYWPGRLLMIILFGALLIQFVHLSIVSTRLLWRKWGPYASDYSVLQQQEEAEEARLSQGPAYVRSEVWLKQFEPKIGNVPTVAWHSVNHAVCFALVVYAIDVDLLDADHGIAWELLEVWVMFTLADFLLQAIIGAATCKDLAPGRLVASKILPAFVPGLSERCDMLLDWVFLGVCGQQGSVLAVILCVVGILIMVCSIRVLHHDFISDLKKEFLVLLASLTSRQASQSLLDQMSSKYKMHIERTENIPQALIKAVFVFFVFQQTSGFVIFTLLFSVVKLLFLAYRSLVDGIRSMGP
jgi:hypothetical protein